MPKRINGWLTPDAIPEGTACRPLLIPNDPVWLGIVSGALSELTLTYRWQRYGAITPEQAAERMRVMFEQYMTEACAGGACPRQWRSNARAGTMQYSDDGGETWEDGDTVVPPPPQVQTPVGQDPACIAAANTVNVLAQVYEQTLDAWNTNTSIEFGQFAFATILGVLISTLLGAPVALVGAAWTVFSLAWDAASFLIEDYWTEQITAQLTCLYLRHLTIVDGIAVYDFDALQEEIMAQSWQSPLEGMANLIWAQVWYLNGIITADGLSHAAATTAITAWDCNDCEGNWEFTMTPDYVWRGAREFFGTRLYSCSNALRSSDLNPMGAVVEISPGVRVWHTELVANNTRLNWRYEMNVPGDTTITLVRVYWMTIGAVNPTDLQFRVNTDFRCNPALTGGNHVQFPMSLSGQSLTIEVLALFNQIRYGYVPYIIFSGTGRNPFL